MIRIAAGEKLPLDAGRCEADRLGDRGPRLCRGSAAQLPALDRPPGALSRAHRAAAGVRVDTGVYRGRRDQHLLRSDDRQAVRLWRRTAARRSAGDARRRSTPSRSAASATTSAFLSALMRHPRFRAGRLTTGFIAEEFPDGFHGVERERGGSAAAGGGGRRSSHHRRRSATPGERAASAAPTLERRWPTRWSCMRSRSSMPVTVAETADGHAVIGDGGSIELIGDWRLGETLYQGRADGRRDGADRPHRHRLSPEPWRRRRRPSRC